MGGNIVSPGFIDIQINGAYGFDFSVYEDGSDAYRRGLKTVAEKIVETGVTSYVSPSLTGGLSRFDLHTNIDLFLQLSYVFVPCYHELS
jgi:N-acetylglucosamine-6-phosphate deacetylase